jgi:hypothetical protein
LNESAARPVVSATKRNLGQSFLAKAERHLRWLRAFLVELRVHGENSRIDDVERILHASILLVASIHEALADAAKVMGQTKWHKALNDARGSDALLCYLWKARNIDSHYVTLKWSEGFEAQIEVIEEDKTEALIDSLGKEAPDIATRLFYFLYDVQTKAEFDAKVQVNRVPPPERLDRAGVRVLFAQSSLIFQSFQIRENGVQRTVEAPRRHEGGDIVPSAFGSLQRAHLYYLARLGELRQRVSAKHA